MKILRKILFGLAGVVLVTVLAIYILSDMKLRAPPAGSASPVVRPTAAQLADGPRQLHVLGCLGCHGDRLQGDVFLDDPKLARLYAPNLTLIAANATDQQLEQAIRRGVGHDGRALVVMPAEGYQFMSDAEVASVIAAIRALPKTGKEVPSRSVGPIGRVGLATGKFHTAPELVRTFRENQPVDLGSQFAVGRHIVAVNCAECHGPKLHGQEVEPGINSPDLEIAGAYDLDQFKTLLREGKAPGGKNIGLMGLVARRDFKYLTDEEIAAIHAYLVERAQRAP